MKNNRFGILVITVLVLSAVALALFGPLLFRKKADKPSLEVRPPASAALTSKGVVESEEEIELGGRASGVIREIRVKEGETVAKGALVVLLDSGKVSAKLEQAEAMTMEARGRLNELEAGFRAEEIEMAGARVNRAEELHSRADEEFRRQERLYAKNATTLFERDKAGERTKVAAEELNEAKANLQKLRKGERKEGIEQARAAVARNSAEKEYYRAVLGDYQIKSPIDGIVVDRLKEPGETVDIGTPIIKLINPQKMRVRAELDETGVGQVVAGQQVEVLADAHVGKVFRGTVYKISPDVKKKAQKTFDPMASFDINTEKIFIRLDDFSGLKNGMTVTVRFLK